MIIRTRNIPAWTVGLTLAGIIALPFLEFAAFFWVASRTGVFAALVLLVATSFVGAALLRRLGGNAFSRLLQAVQTGTRAEGAAREGLMVALGGVLMIIPGFITDVIGFALILPSLLRTLREGGRGPLAQPSRPRADPNGRVVDLPETEWRSIDNQPPRA